MFDDGYTDYCEFLAAGGSFEKTYSRDFMCACKAVHKSNTSQKLKNGLQNWANSHLNVLRK